MSLILSNTAVSTLCPCLLSGPTLKPAHCSPHLYLSQLLAPSISLLWLISSFRTIRELFFQPSVIFFIFTVCGLNLHILPIHSWADSLTFTFQHTVLKGQYGFNVVQWFELFSPSVVDRPSMLFYMPLPQNWSVSVLIANPLSLASSLL